MTVNNFEENDLFSNQDESSLLNIKIRSNLLLAWSNLKKKKIDNQVLNIILYTEYIEYYRNYIMSLQILSFTMGSKFDGS